MSTFTAGRSEVPRDPLAVLDENLITLPTNTIWVWQTSLQANDEVVALGGITSLKGLLFPGTFRMALYDEINGRPNAPVLTMPRGVTVTANNGMQEYILSVPFRVQASGQYWLAMWSSDVNAIKIVTFNLTQLEETYTLGIPAPFALGEWPSGPSLGSILAPVPPPLGVVGFFPSIYARFVHGETLVTP